MKIRIRHYINRKEVSYPDHIYDHFMLMVVFLFIISTLYYIDPLNLILAGHMDYLGIIEFFIFWIVLFGFGLQSIIRSATLLIFPNGILVRKLLGLNIRYKIGNNYFMKVEYNITPKEKVTTKLYIIGDKGRHLISDQGNLKFYTDISRELGYPIHNISAWHSPPP